MNARICRINLNLSPIDFPAINGLSEQLDFTKTEPPTLLNNKVILKITKKLILVESFSDKEYEIFTTQSIYEIPASEIKKKEDIYEFYKDATLGLTEAYLYAKNRIPLPDLSFTTPPIETYQKEINSVFYLLTTRN